MSSSGTGIRGQPASWGRVSGAANTARVEGCGVGHADQRQRVTARLFAYVFGPKGGPLGNERSHHRHAPLVVTHFELHAARPQVVLGSLKGAPLADHDAWNAV